MCNYSFGHQTDEVVPKLFPPGPLTNGRQTAMCSLKGYYWNNDLVKYWHNIYPRKATMDNMLDKTNIKTRFNTEECDNQKPT